MPKYYVQDDVQGWIIDGKDPFSACVKGIYFKMIDSFQVNTRTGQMDGSYLVSERGFDDPKGEVIPTKKVVKKMSGANGMSWFDAFLNAAVMSFFLGWMFFDDGDTLVETEGIDWDGDTGCEVEDYEWEYLDEA